MIKSAKAKKARKGFKPANRRSTRPKTAKAISKSAGGIHGSKRPTTKTSTTHVTRSKAARANISEGLRLYIVAGHPTKSQVIKVYGPKGPVMTWAQRAAAGVDAGQFQEALKAKP